MLHNIAFILQCVQKKTDMSNREREHKNVRSLNRVTNTETQNIHSPTVLLTNVHIQICMYIHKKTLMIR